MLKIEMYFNFQLELFWRHLLYETMKQMLQKYNRRLRHNDKLHPDKL